MIIEISEDIQAGTLQVWDVINNKPIKPNRATIHWSDDQVFELLGEKEYNALHERGKHTFEVAKNRIENVY